MAGTTKVEVTVKPSLAEIRRRLERKRRAVTDLRTPLARAAVYLDQWVQRNFKTEGGGVGGWVPFAKNKDGIPIVEAREPARAPAKLLQRTGRLRSSFSPFATRKEAGIGSDIPYAEQHHKGEGKLPARPMLPEKGSARRTVMRECREIMVAYNREALNQ